jgi:hypothetical protein
LERASDFGNVVQRETAERNDAVRKRGLKAREPSHLFILL